MAGNHDRITFQSVALPKPAARRAARPPPQSPHRNALPPPDAPQRGPYRPVETLDADRSQRQVELECPLKNSGADSASRRVQRRVRSRHHRATPPPPQTVDLTFEPAPIHKFQQTQPLPVQRAPASRPSGVSMRRGSRQSPAPAPRGGVPKARRNASRKPLVDASRRPAVRRSPVSRRAPRAAPFPCAGRAGTRWNVRPEQARNRRRAVEGSMPMRDEILVGQPTGGLAFTAGNSRTIRRGRRHPVHRAAHAARPVAACKRRQGEEKNLTFSSRGFFARRSACRICRCFRAGVKYPFVAGVAVDERLVHRATVGHYGFRRRAGIRSRNRLRRRAATLRLLHEAGCSGASLGDHS